MKPALVTIALLTATYVSSAAAQDVSRVTVDTDRLELRLGESAAPAATALDSSGRPLAGVALRWFTSTPDVVSVEGGIVTAVGAGEGRVSVVAGGAAAFLRVVVLQEASRIQAALPGQSLALGASVSLAVTALDSFGDEIADPGLTFESQDPTVAHVDAQGRVFGRSPGATTVTVRAGDEASVSVPVRVTDQGILSFALTPQGAEKRTGDVIRFTVTATAADGSTFPVRPAWTVSSPGAQIQGEGTDGVFVAESPGTYRVTAQIGEDVSRSALVNVAPRGAQARLVRVGRGPASTHNSGDSWTFQGVDGRDYAYIGTLYYDWAKIWDVTDPAHPILTDSVHADARRINDVKIHPNNRLAIITREQASNRRNGIILLDLSEPAHPQVLSEYTATVTGGVHNVWSTASTTWSTPVTTAPATCTSSTSAIRGTSGRWAAGAWTRRTRPSTTSSSRTDTPISPTGTTA